MSAQTLAALSEHFDVDRLAEALALLSASDRELFATYAHEALFFRSVLDADIQALRPGARVVEIGSGIGLLARLIADEGFQVVAYEPEAAGFGNMRGLGRVVDESWKSPTASLREIPSVFEAGDDSARNADLIVAVNVIEHVADPVALIATATRSLRSGGAARFICPNYAFPYEPHFNMPTAFSKTLTYRLARHRIHRSDIVDAEQFWSELSWPTKRGLRRALRTASIDHQFTTDAFGAYVGRLTDDAFVRRKAGAFPLMAASLRPLLGTIRKWWPLAFAPIIDLRTAATTSTLRTGP